MKENTNKTNKRATKIKYTIRILCVFQTRKKKLLPVSLSIYLPFPLISPDNHGTALKLPPSNVLVFEYRFRPI